MSAEIHQSDLTFAGSMPYTEALISSDPMNPEHDYWQPEKPLSAIRVGLPSKAETKTVNFSPEEQASGTVLSYPTSDTYATPVGDYEIFASDIYGAIKDASVGNNCTSKTLGNTKPEEDRYRNSYEVVCKRDITSDEYAKAAKLLHINYDWIDESIIQNAIQSGITNGQIFPSTHGQGGLEINVTEAEPTGQESTIDNTNKASQVERPPVHEQISVSMDGDLVFVNGSWQKKSVLAKNFKNNCPEGDVCWTDVSGGTFYLNSSGEIDESVLGLKNQETSKGEALEESDTEKESKETSTSTEATEVDEGAPICILKTDPTTGDKSYILADQPLTIDGSESKDRNASPEDRRGLYYNWAITPADSEGNLIEGVKPVYYDSLSEKAVFEKLLREGDYKIILRVQDVDNKITECSMNVHVEPAGGGGLVPIAGCVPLVLIMVWGVIRKRIISPSINKLIDIDHASR